jgi:hypothetical protein
MSSPSEKIDCFTNTSFLSSNESDRRFIFTFLKTIVQNNLKTDDIMTTVSQRIDIFKKKTCISPIIADQTLFHLLSRYLSPGLLEQIKSHPIVGSFINFDLDSAMNKFVDAIYSEFMKNTKSEVILNIIKTARLSNILYFTRNFVEKNNKGKKENKECTAMDDVNESIETMRGLSVTNNIIKNSRYMKMKKIMEIILNDSNSLHNNTSVKNNTLEKKNNNQRGGKKNKIYTGIKGGKYYLKNNKKVYIK